MSPRGRVVVLGAGAAQADSVMKVEFSENILHPDILPVKQRDGLPGEFSGDH
jgi:hypothetical protein